MTESPLEGQLSGGPVFSVVMPAYNAEATIDEAVESVLSQTFESWELVIVDDGSTDRTSSIADAYAASDLRVTVVHQSNSGCGPARSVAIDHSVGRYIVHFDADDVLLPHCLKAYAGFISSHPSYDIFFCNAEVIGQPGPVVHFYGGDDSVFYSFDPMAEFGLEDMLDRCLISSTAAVFTRDIYQRVGGIRLDALTEDYDLWLRAMAAGGRHVYLPEVLVRYRVGPGQMTASTERIYDGTAESLQHLAASGVLDRHLTDVACTSARRYALLARYLRTVAAREKFEARLCGGDVRHARHEFLRVRLAYSSTVKFVAATPLVMMSSRLYAAYVRFMRARRGESSVVGERR